MNKNDYCGFVIVVVDNIIMSYLKAGNDVDIKSIIRKKQELPSWFSSNKPDYDP